MATLAAPGVQTVADLLEQLHVPPERILLRPPPGDATEKDALQSRRLCELIDGVLVEKAMGYYESRLALVLGYFFERFLETNPLGIVIGEGGLIRVATEQLRIPDLGFYAWGHFPDRLLPRAQILDLVPDLAVELLSPTNTKKEMERKRREYFAGGAKLVWQVYPEKRLVHVFTAVDEKIIVDENGTPDGGAVLAGFTLSVKEWFDRAGSRQ